MKRILLYTFLTLASVLVVSCEQTEEPTTATGITLKVDKDVIKCDGTDAATFTVITDEGEVVTDGVTFYSGMEEVEMPGFKFTTAKEGEYSFWASYKTFDTSKFPVTIKAITTTAPEVAADPKPNSTSFVRRVLLTQFTGTQCGYCPGMVNWLHVLRNDLGMKSKTVMAAVHSEMNSGDPAAISSPKSGSAPFNNTSGVPFLSVDMCMGTGWTNKGTDQEYATILKEAIEERILTVPATAGISVNPRFEEGIVPIPGVGNSDGIIARVSVKSSEKAEYAVGAWLVEDNLFGVQSVYSQYVTAISGIDYDTHNNCVRVADSESSGSFKGHEIGVIQAGKTAEKTFLLRVGSKWKLENLHLIVFVTKKDEKGAWSINNVIDCPVDKATPFEYAN